MPTLAPLRPTGRPRLHPRCVRCDARYPQEHGLCRTCSKALAAVGAVVEPAGQATRATHGHLNDWPIGSVCPYHPPVPKAVRRVRVDGREIEFEVVWNGA